MFLLPPPAPVEAEGLFISPLANKVLNIGSLSFEREMITLPSVTQPEPPAPAPASLPKKAAKTRNSGSNIENWRPLVAQYDWPVDRALAIMRCESGGNPGAVGDSHTAYSSYGLMQIRALPGRPAPAWLVIPENNIAYAYGLWKTSGFGPWTCAKKV